MFSMFLVVFKFLENEKHLHVYYSDYSITKFIAYFEVFGLQKFLAKLYRSLLLFATKHIVTKLNLLNFFVVKENLIPVIV